MVFVVAIVIAIIVFVVLATKDKSKTQKLKEIEDRTADYVGYDAERKTLTVSRRDPSFMQRISFEPVMETFVTHHKEKQVFTGVNVGPFVTGTVKTVGGDKTHSRASEHYYMVFNHTASVPNSSDRQTNVNGQVDRIVISDALLGEVDAKVEPYLRGNTIYVVEDGGGKEAHPSFKKIIDIRAWLSMNDAPPLVTAVEQARKGSV